MSWYFVNVPCNLVPDLGMDEDEEEPVPLPNVNAAILKKVNILFFEFDCKADQQF